MSIVDQIEKTLSESSNVQPVTQLIKVMDKLSSSPMHVMRYAQVFDKIGYNIVKSEQIDKFTLIQQARLFKHFTYSFSMNIQRTIHIQNILAKLMTVISAQLD